MDKAGQIKKAAPAAAMATKPALCAGTIFRPDPVMESNAPKAGRNAPARKVWEESESPCFRRRR